VVGWQVFEQLAPEIAAAGIRLLAQNEVALLGTVSAGGRPRIHPFVPRIVEGRLIAFILARSHRFADLRDRGWFAIHAIPGAEDEEFYIAGRAALIDEERAFRALAGAAMGFVTAVRDDEILVEFDVDRALWTTWLDFGTTNHRPRHVRWRVS